MTSKNSFSNFLIFNFIYRDPNSGMKADRILEFNADHPIFAKLQIAVAQDEKKAEDLVKILYTQALLMADLPVENAGEYTDLVCSLIG